jgi:peptide-methionine (S)-S-oxide reductase
MVHNRRAAAALFAVIAGAALIVTSCAAATWAGPFPDPPPDDPSITRGTQAAVLAGGCFWGMEGVFERLKGVRQVVSGYAGGDAATATYEQVSSGRTGHAESVRITYDPGLISYGTILKVFFAVAHDPTELNYQGPDHGTQYRSVIFYSSPGQEAVAERYVAILQNANGFRRPIVTEVAALPGFYPAEAYHQHFMDRYPDYPYIVMWDRPKVAVLDRAFGDLVAVRN